MDVEISKKNTMNNAFYLLQLTKSRVKNGLILYSIRNLISRIGLNISPYYWVLEGVSVNDAPTIKGNESEFSLVSFELDDVKHIASTHMRTRLSPDSLINGYKNGQLFIGLKHNENIAAFMSIELNKACLSRQEIKLKKNEAYLLNMHTYEPYRGKNLAPYLRFKSYELLKERNIDKIYSITEYFNKSSYKFKKKLNAKILKLYLSITIFKKYHKTFKIKDYSN